MTSKTHRDWQSNYKRKIAFIDACVVLWATAGALVLRFGEPQKAGFISDDGRPYILLALMIASAWWVMLGLWGSRDVQVTGYGPDEFKRLINASFWLFGLVAILSYVLRYDTARGFVFLALPAGVGGLVVARLFLRKILHLNRLAGESCSRVMVLGSSNAVLHLVNSLRKKPEAGYQPVAAYYVDITSAKSIIDPGLPTTIAPADVNKIIRTLENGDIDALAISAGSNLAPVALRQLGWELADRSIRMIVAPALTDIAGPRIHAQPVAGLSLIHVSTPKLTGIKWATKRGFDILGSALLLLLLAPLFLATAISVKLTSPGPIFYSQERIGFRGSIFKMYKFRSMRVNADDELQTLLASQGTTGRPLFKVADDPRVTPVGRYLRKYSIDELPQLLNVLLGSMSLVGPRPQRADEVALYNSFDHRRLYVSPGMSGLWQVSGRSNLSWEDAIQLDLYYVENWSLTQDISILLKTFRAVFMSDGAI